MTGPLSCRILPGVRTLESEAGNRSLSSCSSFALSCQETQSGNTRNPGTSSVFGKGTQRLNSEPHSLRPSVALKLPAYRTQNQTKRNDASSKLTRLLAFRIGIAGSAGCFMRSSSFQCTRVPPDLWPSKPRCNSRLQAFIPTFAELASTGLSDCMVKVAEVPLLPLLRTMEDRPGTDGATSPQRCVRPRSSRTVSLANKRQGQRPRRMHWPRASKVSHRRSFNQTITLVMRCNTCQTVRTSCLTAKAPASEKTGVGKALLTLPLSDANPLRSRKLHVFNRYQGFSLPPLSCQLHELPSVCFCFSR